jgi:hypothetical protein
MNSKEVTKILVNELVSLKRMAVINNFFSDELHGEADVLSLTNNFFVYEYEIKISRSDFFADFKKHFKHSILKREDWIVGTRYENKIANYFFYVVPENLIALNEVPHYAGLIYISDGKTKTIKEAPRLHNNRAGEKLLRSLLKNYTYKLSKTFKGE